MVVQEFASAARALLLRRSHLQVHLGIPVGVVQDNHVGGVQVDAEAAGTRGQQEDELLGSLSVVRVDLALPVLAAGVAVNAAVLVACGSLVLVSGGMSVQGCKRTVHVISASGLDAESPSR